MPPKPMTNLRAMAKRIETWLIDKLIPFARNPRTHSEAQIAQIAASIQEFGFNLGGHLKTGHTWSLQNRPTERTQNKSSYNSTTIV